VAYPDLTGESSNIVRSLEKFQYYSRNSILTKKIDKKMIQFNCKVSSKEWHIVIFTIILDMEPDPILLSDLDRQIISDPGLSGYGSTTL
jgi:hypothetical protein